MINVKVLEETKTRIQAEIERQTGILLSGVGINNFDDYRYYIGGIKGLRDSIQLIDQVVADLNEVNSK